MRLNECERRLSLRRGWCATLAAVLISTGAMAEIGVDWVPEAYGRWSPRQGHAAVSFNGKMWVIGGTEFSGAGRNDVVSSVDGTAWSQATGTAPWVARAGHAVLVFDNKLWVMGGTTESGEVNDVWYSSDGVTWTEATSSAPWASRTRFGSAALNGRMWVFGGRRTIAKVDQWLNDVWSSEDGVNWVQESAGAAWAAREAFGTAVLDGKIWLMGGRGSTFPGQDDVWYTEDGQTWTEATAQAGWQERQYLTAAAYDGKLYIMGGENIDSEFLNDVWSSSNGVDWTQVTADSDWKPRYYQASVVHDNLLWVLGGSAGAGVGVDDLNDIWYSMDGAAWSEAPFPPIWATRSASGVAVHLGKLWVMGGRDTKASRNDVWSSGNGSTWTQETAAANWAPRNALGVTSFDGKLWVMGGYTVASNAQNDVWSSTDGVNWTQVTAAAAWSARAGFELVDHDNKLWVIGGFAPTERKNDVWYSSDGATWTAATLNAPWSPRGGLAAVSFNGKLWVMGGDTGLNASANDVWSSNDGVSWTQETASAAWAQRLGHEAVALGNTLWVMGGYNTNDDTLRDVWSSTNGVTWTLATDSAPWLPRLYFGAAAFGSYLWVMGGLGGTDDVWSSGPAPDQPVVTIGAPSVTSTRTGPVTFTLTYTNASAVTLTAGDITLNRTGSANGQIEVSGAGTTTRTVTITNITGDGTLGISVAQGTASNGVNNFADAAGPSQVFSVDNTGPSIAISEPSTTATRNGPVTFTITYGDAASVTLNPGHISFLATGSVTGTVDVSGAGTSTRTVTVSNIAGDGTFSIAVAAGTAADALGNLAGAAGPSVSVGVNSTLPAVGIGAPSVPVTATGPVTYTITYANATSVTLTPGNVTLHATGTANGTISVSGAGATTRTVTISNIVGDGTLGISIEAGTASDGVGNLAPAAGPSHTFAVDNTPPGVTIGEPSVTATRNGPVHFEVVYSGASLITLDAGDAILDTTGTATGTVSVAEDGVSSRVVTVSNITGTGTLGIRLVAGTAVDAAGNLAGAAGPSGIVAVSSDKPAVGISAPSSTQTNGANVSYLVSYSNAISITLSPADVTLIKTGTANGVVSVTGSGTTERTVTISSITGAGTLAIQIAPGTASDGIGNLADGAGPSAAVTVFRRTDVNRSGSVNALDIQLVVNAALGINIAPWNGDVNGDGFVNAIDIQLVVNAVLGVGPL